MQVVPTAGQPDLTPFEQAVDRLELAVSAPTVIQRLLATMSDPRSSTRDIEEVLTVDAGLVTRVLKLASSAAYARRPVRDLRGAVQIIGLDQLRRLAVTAHFAQGKSRFARELWAYALAVAFTCDQLAVATRTRGGPDVFLCGLLHDIGTLVLDKLLGAQYGSLAIVPGEDRQLEVERRALGFDHADLGAMAVARWNLFPELELVTQLHHHPLELERLGLGPVAQTTVELVALARLMVLDDRAPRRDDPVGDELRGELCRRRGVTTADAQVCAGEGAAQAYAVMGALAA